MVAHAYPSRLDPSAFVSTVVAGGGRGRCAMATLSGGGSTFATGRSGCLGSGVIFSIVPNSVANLCIAPSATINSAPNNPAEAVHVAAVRAKLGTGFKLNSFRAAEVFGIAQHRYALNPFSVCFQYAKFRALALCALHASLSVR